MEKGHRERCGNKRRVKKRETKGKTYGGKGAIKTGNRRSETVIVIDKKTH